MLSKKELDKIILDLEKEPDTIDVKVYKAILDNLCLNVGRIDPSATEVLEMDSKDIVAIKDFDKLNCYLLAISKYIIYILNYVNKGKIYMESLERNYWRQLIELQNGQYKNLIRNLKSNKEKEDYILMHEKKLETTKITIDMVKAYYNNLATYIPCLQSLESDLKYVINKRRIEFEMECRRRQ